MVHVVHAGVAQGVTGMTLKNDSLAGGGLGGRVEVGGSDVVCSAVTCRCRGDEPNWSVARSLVPACRGFSLHGSGSRAGNVILKSLIISAFPLA